MAERNGSSGGWLCVGLIAIGLYACSHRNSPEKQVEKEQAVVSGEAPAPSAIDSVQAAVSPDREFDEDRAQEAAQEYVGGETYESVVGSSDCTDDCSGHEAGWQWARDNDADCGGGDSPSFDEGCQAFKQATDDRVDIARAAFENGDATFETQ